VGEMGAGLGAALALVAGYVVVTSVAVPVSVLLLVDRRVRLEALQPGRELDLLIQPTHTGEPTDGLHSQEFWDDQFVGWRRAGTR
jgi:hypothetical protein